MSFWTTSFFFWRFLLKFLVGKVYWWLASYLKNFQFSFICRLHFSVYVVLCWCFPIFIFTQCFKYSLHLFLLLWSSKNKCIVPHSCRSKDVMTPCFLLRFPFFLPLWAPWLWPAQGWIFANILIFFLSFWAPRFDVCCEFWLTLSYY